MFGEFNARSIRQDFFPHQFDTFFFQAENRAPQNLCRGSGRRRPPPPGSAPREYVPLATSGIDEISERIYLSNDTSIFPRLLE